LSATVTLLHSSKLCTAEEAARMCTMTKHLTSTEEIGNATFIKKLVDMGHESIIEHLVYTFEISGVSRALLQEMARHRIASLSVLSTRWALTKILEHSDVDGKSDIPMMYYIPEDTMSDDELTDYLNSLESIDHIATTYHKKWKRNDHSKYLFPEALKTEFYLTLNARELKHLFELRTSPRALHEFKMLCIAIFSVIPTDHKFIYAPIFKSITY